MVQEVARRAGLELAARHRRLLVREAGAIDVVEQVLRPPPADVTSRWMITRAASVDLADHDGEIRAVLRALNGGRTQLLRALGDEAELVLAFPPHIRQDVARFAPDLWSMRSPVALDLTGSGPDAVEAAHVGAPTAPFTLHSRRFMSVREALDAVRTLRSEPTLESAALAAAAGNYLASQRDPRAAETLALGARLAERVGSDHLAAHLLRTAVASADPRDVRLRAWAGRLAEVSERVATLNLASKELELEASPGAGLEPSGVRIERLRDASDTRRDLD